MTHAQIVSGNEVVNVIVVDPSAAVSSGGSKITWSGGEFDAPAGSTLMMQEGAAIGWTLSGGVLSPVAPPVPTQSQLTAYAATVRYAKETGGFSFQSHPIATDEGSQAKIGNAALGATVVGAGFSTDWKCSDGTFVTLNQAGMLGMATAILNFVNACYAAEAAIDAAIGADTITTTAQIDGYAWPTASA